MEMDYKKLYEEALERAKQWSNGDFGHSVDDTPKSIAEFIFPQLKESEDERIRKAIYNCVKWFGFDSYYFKNVSQEECLAWLEKQSESKWSEEDEEMLSYTISLLSEFKEVYEADAHKCIDWLKSIKPQPKQEWSVNDERILYNIHSYIDYAKDSKYHTPEKMVEAKVWLDSLKNRIQPHWKPTEEQLMALRDAIDNNEMESLYNDLKKL